MWGAPQFGDPDLNLPSPPRPQKVAVAEVESSYSPYPITSGKRRSDETTRPGWERVLRNLMMEAITGCILYKHLRQLFARAQRRLIWNRTHAALPGRSVSLLLFCRLQKNLEHTGTTSQVHNWPGGTLIITTVLAPPRARSGCLGTAQSLSFSSPQNPLTQASHPLSPFSWLERTLDGAWDNLPV